MENANVRNLDDIQEEDRGRRSSRLGVLLLGSLGVGALALVAIVGRESGGAARQSDDQALVELVESHRARAGETAPDVLAESDATFAGILSDEPNPTTAMVAVKDQRGRLVAREGANQSEGARLLPPAAEDRLPVVPLPAGTLLNATPVTLEPKDPMTALAARVATADSDATSPPGAEGGFQIQVASFKDKDDAERFVTELRKRGHAAYRQPAEVPGRGLWHRVRIGPFDNKYQAELYRKKLEAKERTAAFVVDPHQVERAERARTAKLEARAARAKGD